MKQIRTWKLAHGRQLELGITARIMGVLNVTPDSFSDGGRYTKLEQAIARVEAMLAEGADIIDIGGESTRPGAEPVGPEEEQARVLPIIEALAKRGGAILSIDSYHAQTARLAVEAGVHIVNDIWGLQKDPAMAEVAAGMGAGLVLMHNGREREKLPDVIADQFAFLSRSVEIAREHGVAGEHIVLDPGFGFAKDTQENAQLIARFSELARFELPFAVGTSRKGFIGEITARERSERAVGTAATSAILRLKGASIFRVHDIAANRDALRIADAVLAAEG